VSFECDLSPTSGYGRSVADDAERIEFWPEAGKPPTQTLTQTLTEHDRRWSTTEHDRRLSTKLAHLRSDCVNYITDDAD
jgi:hypothetical protein